MKKTIMAVLVAMGVGTSAFSMDEHTVNLNNQKVDIWVGSYQEFADVKKMSEVLIVTPKDDQVVLGFLTNLVSDSQYLFIDQSDKKPALPLSFVKNSNDYLTQNLVLVNPYQLKVHSDFTHLDPLVSTQSYHDIHNGGYHIAANSQTYKDSTFAFASDGAVQLNPRSPSFQQNMNPLMALLNNHLSGTKANTAHQPSVEPGCFVKSIKARPYGATQRDAAIDGTISYGKVFDMNLSVQGMVLEFTPNDGFQFNLMG